MTSNIRSQTKILAVIPARGGSKGIPNKNKRLLGGKPLIAHSVEAAINSKLIERVVVSTDDPEIAELGRQYGAETPSLRPKNLSGDRAIINDAVWHTIQSLDVLGWHAFACCTLFPTHPFRKFGLIDNLLEKLLEGYDRVLTVKSIPSYRASFFSLQNGDYNFVSALGREKMPKKFYRKYGLFEAFLINPTTGRSYFYEIDYPAGFIDIDFQEDLVHAEMILQHHKFNDKE